MAENSVDYSLMNTVRHMLFLPTTREQKYKAKQVIDSFVVRAGDIALRRHRLPGHHGARRCRWRTSPWINVVLVVVWLGVCDRHRRRVPPPQRGGRGREGPMSATVAAAPATPRRTAATLRPGSAEHRRAARRHRASGLFFGEGIALLQPVADALHPADADDRAALPGADADRRPGRAASRPQARRLASRGPVAAAGDHRPDAGGDRADGAGLPAAGRPRRSSATR